MPRLSTQLEAQALAADAAGWLRSIRHAQNRQALEGTAKEALSLLKSRHACGQIIQHFNMAISEERLRLATAEELRPSRKMAAAGDSA